MHSTWLSATREPAAAYSHHESFFTLKIRSTFPVFKYSVGNSGMTLISHSLRFGFIPTFPTYRTNKYPQTVGVGFAHRRKWNKQRLRRDGLLGVSLFRSVGVSFFFFFRGTPQNDGFPFGSLQHSQKGGGHPQKTHPCVSNRLCANAGETLFVLLRCKAWPVHCH